MKMPLLVVTSDQNSALISKSLYDVFETRCPPLPLSATIAPPSARQLASPTRLKLSRPRSPSITETHPAEGSWCPHPATPSATTSGTAATAKNLFMVFLPLWLTTYSVGILRPPAPVSIGWAGIARDTAGQIECGRGDGQTVGYAAARAATCVRTR